MTFCESTPLYFLPVLRNNIINALYRKKTAKTVAIKIKF